MGREQEEHTHSTRYAQNEKTLFPFLSPPSFLPLPQFLILCLLLVVPLVSLCSNAFVDVLPRSKDEQTALCRVQQLVAAKYGWKRADRVFLASPKCSKEAAAAPVLYIGAVVSVSARRVLLACLHVSVSVTPCHTCALHA